MKKEWSGVKRGVEEGGIEYGQQLNERCGGERAEGSII